MRQGSGQTNMAWLGAALAAAAWAGEATAQATKPKAPPGKAPAEAPTPELPANAETITLQTEDGVFLVATYFKAKAGRQTGVLIAPNAADRTQREWFPLAKELAEDGVSVVTFDFRGHGQSIALAADSPLAKRGADTPRLRKEDVQRILPTLLKDFDAVKQFLLHEHNAGAVNIRQTGALALGDMATAATFAWLSTREFAPNAEWSANGGDVAAVGLVSPALVYKQLRAGGPPQFPGAWGALAPTLVVSTAGKTPGHDAAEKLARGLRLAVLTEQDPADKRYRKDSGWLKVAAAAPAKGKAADLGNEILRAAEHEKVRVHLRGFFKARLAARKEAPWEGPRETNDLVKVAVRKGPAN